jgi:hypothetical protein
VHHQENLVAHVVEVGRRDAETTQRVLHALALLAIDNVEL